MPRRTHQKLQPDDVVAIHQGREIVFAVIVDRAGHPVFQLADGTQLSELAWDPERIEHVDVGSELAFRGEPNNRGAWLDALAVATAAAQIPLDQRDLAYDHALHGLTRGQIALRWLALLRHGPVRLDNTKPGAVLARKLAPPGN